MGIGAMSQACAEPTIFMSAQNIVKESTVAQSCTKAEPSIKYMAQLVGPQPTQPPINTGTKVGFYTLFIL